MRPPMVKEYQDFGTLSEFFQIDSLTIDDETGFNFSQINCKNCQDLKNYFKKNVESDCE